MSRKDLEALLGYLRENSGLYSMEALRAQIVRAGHAPAAAERAIAVFEGRAPRPEPSIWLPALLVAAIDSAFTFLCYSLFFHYGTGKVACSAVALLAGAYLAQLVASFILFAAAKERWGRILLLGLLLFCGLGLLVLLGLLIRWLAKVTGS
jgi:hypothetical protein